MDNSLPSNGIAKHSHYLSTGSLVAVICFLHTGTTTIVGVMPGMNRRSPCATTRPSRHEISMPGQPLPGQIRRHSRIAGTGSLMRPFCALRLTSNSVCAGCNGNWTRYEILHGLPWSPACAWIECYGKRWSATEGCSTACSTRTTHDAVMLWTRLRQELSLLADPASRLPCDCL